MQGITVREEIEKREIEKPILTMILIAIVATIVIAVVTFIKCIAANQFVMCVPVVLAATFMVKYGVDMWKIYNDSWMEYLVEIDDSVSMNQFMKKYKIVNEEEDGQYRVRMR